MVICRGDHPVDKFKSVSTKKTSIFAQSYIIYHFIKSYQWYTSLGLRGFYMGAYMVQLDVYVRAWRSNHITLFYMDLNSNPWLNPDAALSNPCAPTQ